MWKVLGEGPSCPSPPGSVGPVLGTKEEVQKPRAIGQDTRHWLGLSVRRFPCPAQEPIQRRPALAPCLGCLPLFNPGPGWEGKWCVLSAGKIPLCWCHKSAAWFKKDKNTFCDFPVVWWVRNLCKKLSSVSTGITYPWSNWTEALLSQLLSKDSFCSILLPVLLVLLMKKPCYLKIWEKNFSASNGRKKKGRPWKGPWGPYIMKTFVKMV